MADKARFATAHWLRFKEVTLPEQLDLSRDPENALSWKIGTSGPVGPDGLRLPSEIWCAVALYRGEVAARAAFENRLEFMPFIGDAVESWHQLLIPVKHYGTCNHLDRECPGEIFEVSSADPGGPLMVITTAGYVLAADVNMDRIVPFRQKVDHVNEWLSQMDGCLASRPFTPYKKGNDGCTLSVWRSDEAMLNAMYRGGAHRGYIDGHRAVNDFDRSSFTRFRLLDASGEWNGGNPMART